MTLTTEEMTVNVRSTLWQIIEELPTEQVTEVLDFALSIQQRLSDKPSRKRTQAQLDAIRKLYGSGRGEHLVERLLASRAEDRSLE